MPQGMHEVCTMLAKTNVVPCAKAYPSACYNSTHGDDPGVDITCSTMGDAYKRTALRQSLLITAARLRPFVACLCDSKELMRQPAAGCSARQAVCAILKVCQGQIGALACAGH